MPGWLRWLLWLVGLLVLLQVGAFVGYGLYHGLDVVSGVGQAARLYTHTDLIRDGARPVDAGALQVREGEVAWTGDLQNEALNESSGLAAGARKDVLFSINDSGNQPRLFALSFTGEDRGSWRIDHEGWHDFEDLAAFTLDATDYLMIADTGDNFYWRPVLRLLIIAEPDIESLSPDAVLPVEWTVEFYFDDGYRDVEAVAVDEGLEQVFFLSKRHVPPELFSIPLRGGDKPLPATRLARVTGIPEPTARERREDPEFGDYRSVPTAFDINGRHALVVTYKDAYLFTRKRSQSWQQVMSGLPVRIPLPLIYGLESGTFAEDAIYVTGEREGGISRMGLFRVDL